MPPEIFPGTWKACTEQPGLCSTTLCLVMKNPITSPAQQDPTHGASTNRALSNDEEPPKHTSKLPMDLSPFIKPVFTELSKRELLEKCVLGSTQNQNESLNNIIWSWVPKNRIWFPQNGKKSSPSTVVWKDSRPFFRICLVLLHVALQLATLHLAIQSG